MNEDIFKANMYTPGMGGRTSHPRIYWGPPGVGKTSRIRTLAKILGLTCIVVLASIRDPADFNGMPVPSHVDFVLGEAANTGLTDDTTGHNTADKTMVTFYAPPQWALEAAKKGNVLIFFDEISTASPAVQAALLRVVLDGVVGDLELPPSVRFVAAANPENMAAGGFDLSPPLANRFGHEEVNLSPEGKAVMSVDEIREWCSWALTSGESMPAVEATITDPDKEMERVMDLWPAAYARAKGLVTAFMASPASTIVTEGQEPAHCLLNMPDINTPQASRAWPSPRSWEAVMRALASADIHGLSDEDTDEWIASLVGIGPVAAFRAFMRDANLPRAEDYLDSVTRGQPLWTHDPTRLDRTLVMLNACTSLVIANKGKPSNKDREAALWTAMYPMTQSSPDVCVASVEALVTAGMAFGSHTSKPLAAMRPTLAALGIVG